DGGHRERHDGLPHSAGQPVREHADDGGRHGRPEDRGSPAPRPVTYSTQIRPPPTAAETSTTRGAASETANISEIAAAARIATGSSVAAGVGRCCTSIGAPRLTAR